MNDAASDATYNVTAAELRQFIEQYEHLESEKKDITEQQKEIMAEAKGRGYDTKVMRNSEGPMLLLLRFMQANPKVRVEIQGHVTGPTYKNTKEFIELSTGRARTVYDFLLVNDVDPARISYVGLGNSQMLFPEPKNKEQSEANRRVEVKIISN